MAAVRGLDGIHRKRADGVGELAFGQCHSSPGNGWAIMRDCPLRGGGPKSTARGKKSRKKPGSPVSPVLGNCAHPAPLLRLDRKSVVSGKSVSVRVDLVGRRVLTKKNNKKHQ